MNFLIVGDGPEELAWAVALAERSEHRLVAAWPGLKAFPELPGRDDFEAALAVAGIEAVVVGGPISELRGEALRRVAGGGWSAIAIHPPGPDAGPYYNVAMSRQETGAIVVPDLPARRNPGVDAIAAASEKRALGEFRELRYEVPIGPGATDLVGTEFARVVDVLRAVLGEVEAVTATGDPPGERPSLGLVVQMRGPAGRRGEARLTVTPLAVPARLVLVGSEGTLALEHDPAWLGPARLVRQTARDGETVTDLPPFDPHAAILRVLESARLGEPRHPNLLDGTRAMELTEAVARSLKRGRTVDLHYEEMSELGTFKSTMTGLGCGLLVLAVCILPVALAGPALGFRWTIYLAWLVPPVLVLFVLLQVLRFGVSKPTTSVDAPTSPSGTAE